MRLTGKPSEDPSPQTKCEACNGWGTRVRLVVMPSGGMREQYLKCEMCDGHGSLGLREKVRLEKLAQAGGVMP